MRVEVGETSSRVLMISPMCGSSCLRSVATEVGTLTMGDVLGVMAWGEVGAQGKEVA